MGQRHRARGSAVRSRDGLLRTRGTGFPYRVRGLAPHQMRNAEASREISQVARTWGQIPPRRFRGRPGDPMAGGAGPAPRARPPRRGRAAAAGWREGPRSRPLRAPGRGGPARRGRERGASGAWGCGGGGRPWGAWWPRPDRGGDRMAEVGRRPGRPPRARLHHGPPGSRPAALRRDCARRRGGAGSLSARRGCDPPRHAFQVTTPRGAASPLGSPGTRWRP